MYFLCRFVYCHPFAQASSLNSGGRMEKLYLREELQKVLSTHYIPKEVNLPFLY